uniref:N-terminal methionine N(alpha)-acetyltransferase NatE n=1 Tax=Caenorhabditis tropicalis TaxID=1561998 RepID=A0A1I7TLA0_9PELO
MASQLKQCNSSEMTGVDSVSEPIRVECLSSDNYHEFSTICRLILQKVTDQFVKNACNNPKLTAIAYCEGKCVGVIICEDKKDSSLAITDIGVLDEFQRRGVGTALMNHVYNIAKEMKSVTTLEFVVVGENRTAMKLAASAGFSTLPNANSTTVYFMKNVSDNTVAMEVEESISDVIPKKDNEFNIRSLKLSDIKTLKVLNQTVVLDSFKKRFYNYVKTFPKFSAVAIMNNTLLGAVCCEKKKLGVYRLLHILTLVVADEYESLKLDIQRALLKHVVNLAEDSTRIEKITFYVKTPVDGSSINYSLDENSEMYFTKNVTKNMFPIPKALKRSKHRDDLLVAEVLAMEMVTKNASVPIEALKPGTVQVLKTLNDRIFGAGFSDTVFAKVLDEPNVTFLASRNNEHVGFINCAKIAAANGKCSLCIKIIGVLPHYRRKGVAGDLLEHLVQFAENTENLDFIWGNVQENNEAAKKTFLNGGFVQSGRVPKHFGEVAALVYFMDTKAGN